jgi:hypothetical protein
MWFLGAFRALDEFGDIFDFTLRLHINVEVHIQ